MGRSGHLYCPACGRVVRAVDVETAAKIARVSIRTIYRWSEGGLLHLIKMAGRRPQVCRDSLHGSNLRGSGRSPALDTKLKLAMGLIEDRYHDPHLSLERIAERLALSVWQLSRLFKKAGVGFRDHLRVVRMKRAAELLRDPGMSVKEVAAAVGYGNVSQFDRHFKKTYGRRPQDYRRSLV